MLKENPSEKAYKGKPPVLSHLSASSLGSYLLCGLQWRMQRIDRLKPIRKEKSYFKFGETFHKSMELHWKGGVPNFRDEWLRYKDTPLDYGRESWLTLYNKGLKMVEGITLATAGKFDPLYTRTELNENLDLGFVVVNRRIDVITVAKRLPIMVNGLVEKIDGEVILDLKTAGMKYSLDSINQSQQLMTYALPNKIKDRDPVMFAYVVATKSITPTIQLIGKKFSKEELRGQVRRYKQVSDLIKQGVFIQNKGTHCTFCDFRKLCYNEHGWQHGYEIDETKNARSTDAAPDNKSNDRKLDRVQNKK